MHCHGSKRCGCGCMKMARGYWNNFPYYTGPCPNGDGCYCAEQEEETDNDTCCERCERCDRCDRCDRCRRCKPCCQEKRCRWHRHCCGMFMAFMPMAIGPNGIVPLCVNNPCRESDFSVNSGLITLEKAGTYMATYNVKVPETAALDTTITLNVDGASQSTATTLVSTAAGDTTSNFSGQAIFEAAEGATVSLRSSEAISVTDPASQPMFTLSLVQMGE